MMVDKGQRSILVVDNDMKVLQMVEKALQKNKYKVHLATDGALAINRALAEPPDIVVSAVEMPLLDGFKLCQLLRTNPITRDIPFLFLTSKETSVQRLGTFLRPFDEFLLKPFKGEELLGRITALLERLEKVAQMPAGEQQALLGTLTEITLMDLLQVLRMNRRSGFLDLEQGGVSPPSLSAKARSSTPSSANSRERRPSSGSSTGARGSSSSGPSPLRRRSSSSVPARISSSRVCASSTRSPSSEKA